MEFFMVKNIILKKNNSNIYMTILKWRKSGMTQ